MTSHHTPEKIEVVWRTLPSTHRQGQQRTCLYSLVTLVSLKGQQSVLCPSTASSTSLSLPPVVPSLLSGCLFPLHSWLTADKSVLVALRLGKSKAKTTLPLRPSQWWTAGLCIQNHCGALHNSQGMTNGAHERINRKSKCDTVFQGDIWLDTIKSVDAQVSFIKWLRVFIAPV